ncbi:MarR family transcriptional regulator [Dyella sp.]|jgi:DNA-binding MarR family transcriptional regulator|uniref:MarR family winged helix-turn-helix transcriptional regulator n=1 Tax=Dyella sp. TaxID=1869338 RepID=UPI002D775A66|nr:MarR family transcriptional regulator [Dyella sp.]HET6434070.1 MarR family transcriptional regulator [Dyella sp.]
MTRPHSTPAVPAPPADDASPLCLKRQLCFALYAASNRVTRLARPALDALGLTYPQYLVLLVLWEHAPCTVGEIGHALMLDSGTLTPLLKRMEANGLLTRTRDPADERCVRIALSPQGRALKRRAAEIPAGMRGQLGLPPEAIESLREQLHALLAAIEPPADER